MRKIYLLLLILVCFSVNLYAQTATINCTGAAGSFNSGYVTSGGAKTDGNLIVDGVTTLRRGWASFDLSSIPAGSTVSSVTLKFTVTSNNAASGVNNGIFGFTGTPSSIAGATLYANCGSGTNFNNAVWTQNTTNSLAFNAAGITFITGRLGSTCNIGFVRGAGSSIFNIGGYPAALQPQLVINYTLPPYKAQFISMSTGSTTWCAGETRSISVTVKNVGSATWTNAAPDVNLGLKWNTNGANWADYYIRTDANNLAPGATQTYTFNITASNNIGAGYTTPLGAGTNNLTFDIVKEGDCWFGNNSGSCGPGNTIFTSPNQTIVALPAAPTGSVTQTFCASANPTVSNLSATGSNIKWYPTSSGGAALPGATALINGTHYYASQTNGSGCESSARLDVTAVVNANSVITLSSAAGTNNQSACIGAPITNITYSISGGGTGATISGLPTGVNGSYSGGTFTISGAPTGTGTFNYTVNTTGPCTNTSANGTITVSNNGTIALSSAAGTNTQSICLSAPIDDITYNIGGAATSASITAGALPPGVSGSFSAGIFTITGTPAVPGIYNYTVGTSGSTCINQSLSGSITVNETGTISLSSASGTDAQSLCALVAITDITYSIGGFGTTGATVSGLPAGVNGSYSAGVFTISGSPAAAGIFNYTVTTTGPCTNNSLNGTITLSANGTVTLSSASGTDAQTICVNNPITDITYAIDPSANDATITGGSLPAGVTGSFSAGVFTITGTPTTTGTYSYTITASGSSCANFSANGVINVNEDATISLSSASGTDAQTVCINNAITNITYAIGGFGTTGATVSGLPAGVTGNYNAGVFTISGTATASGVFNYTVSTTGTCANQDAIGTITVGANSTISLTSGTASQTKCINVALTTVTYTIGGGGTGASLSAGSFPPGVTGSFAAGIFTISGTPAVAGVFPYSITTSGPCINPTLSGTITVNDDATIVLSSAAGTDNQTKCINTAITAITYTIGGGGTGATVSGLPTGVTGSFSAGVYTISGTATASGTFNYTVTTTGPCVKPAATGTITVQANSTITRTSAGGTDNQTKCINTAITNITYAIGGGGMGASLSAGAFPAGITGSFSAGVFTISGIPTVAGVFNYTITTSGPCVNPSLSGTITVQDDATIALTSAPATTSQTICINTAISNITYAIGGGGTGATVSGLPTGVTGSFSGGVYTISGTATATGTFNYTITTTGPCVKPAFGGTIIVQANSTITRTSAVGTDAQTKCINTAINNITYSVGGGGTAISLTAGSLPAGVTGSFSAGIFTITGTATAIGVFSYTLTATGPCVNATATGTITIQDDATIALTSAPATTNQSVCISTPITAITYSIGGGGTGATTTGLPTGVTGSYNNGTHVYTISGTPTVSGTFNYTVTSSGPCIKPALSGTIVVNPNATITRTSALATANQTVCINNAIVNITYSIGGSGTNATVTGLPAGVNANFAAGTLTISGAPTASGVFNYTVTPVGPCVNPSLSGTITVNDNGTIALTSAPATTNQTVCINTAITAITYSIGGFGSTGATTTGLPAGVNGSYNNGTHVYTISGSPTVSGTFNYTVTTAGPCIKPFLTGTIVVRPNATISLTSAAGSNIQTLCQNTAIVNITYSVGGSGNGATATNLPAGVTGTYNAGTYTISGTATASGTFNYVVTATGPCVNPSLSGILTVSAQPTGLLTATESSVTPNDNIICAGSNVTFNATPGYGSYTFRINGIIAQSGISSVFNTSALTNGQSVTVDVANAANCGATFGPIAITVNALPVPSLVADRTTICPGDNIVFTAGGGTSYTFKVNGSAVQSGASNIYSSSTLSNGNSVTVTVTNANGCSATSSPILIAVNALPAGTLTASSTSICTGDNVTFTATSGYSNYNFKVNGISVQNGSSNTYSSTTLTNPSVVTVDVTNAATCQVTFNPIVVTVNSLPSGTLTATENSGTANDNSICSGSNVSFTATAGFSNYDFKVNGVSQLSGASNTFNTISLSNGDVVTVTASNGSGCSATFNAVNITVIPSPSGSLIATTSNICIGDNVDFTATAGYSNYDFKVNGGTVQNGPSNTYSTTGLANADVVTVVVTGSNGCVNTFNPINIIASALPSGTLVAVENSGSIANDGNICTGATVVFTAPAGYSNYNFLLNAISIQNGASDTYTNSTLNDGDLVSVAVTNASGCIALLNTIIVSVGTYPVVDPITGPSAVCVSGTITLSSLTSGGVWSSGNTARATVDASGVVTGVAAGAVVISYTVTNANGCSTAVSVLINVHGLPFVAPITGSADVCIGNTIQLSNTVTGGVWSSDDMGIATVDAAGLVTGITDGTTVINYAVTNAFGCTKTSHLTITVNAPPVLNPITGDITICKGSTSLLANDTDGGIWSSDNTSVATVNSTGLVTGVLAGNATISYTVTDGNGCSATETVVVTILDLPVPTLSGPNPICPNSTGIYTTEAGQLNYTWTFTGGTLIAGGTSTDNTITILWDQAGPKTIHVNYTNAEGCFGAASATVTTSTGIIPFLSGAIETCLNSAEIYTTDPGQSNYTWSVAGGNITAGGTITDNTATVTWNTSGAGSVQINYDDVNGCTVVSPTILNVTVHTLPNAIISGNTAVCQNATSPLITFTGSNGSAPYTFTYNINSEDDLTVTTVSGNSVTVSVPTSVTGTFIYNLTSVSDNNSCTNSLSSSVTATINELPTATVGSDATVCQNNPASVTFTGVTGTAPFTFFYNINGSGPTLSATTISGNSITIPVATGTSGTFVYTLLSVSDVNNCTQAQTGTATITVNPSPTASISGTTSVCQNATAVDISFTGANGSAPYTFTYNINNTGNLTVVSVGNTATVSVPTTTAGIFNYNLVSVQESGANTCSQIQTGTATVTVSATTAGGSAGTSNTVCSGTNSGTLTLTGNIGNVTGWEFSTDAGSTWTPIANTTTTQNYTNLTQTTIYHAIVQSGVCASAVSTNAIITVTPASVGGSVTSNAIVCSGSNSGTLTLSGHTGSVTRWEFSINGGASWTPIANTTTTQNYTNLTQTTLYRAVITNGVCASVNAAFATITVNALPTATISGTATVCQNAAAPVISFTGANGTAPYTFTYKINAGGNQTIVSVGNIATLNAPTGVAGVFTYTLVSVQSSGSPACSQNQAGTATITVSGLPSTFAITPASAAICQGTVQPLSAAGGTPTSGSLTFSSGNINLPIPEGNRAHTIAVAGIPAGAVINSVSVNFNITHGYDADLVINLQAPNGNRLNLVNERGGNGDNFTNTTISSTSVNPINAAVSPFPGTYAADAANNVGTPNSNVTAFSSLYGTPNGNWTFNADDETDCHGGFLVCLFGGGTYYTGTLNSWSITFNYTVPVSPINVVWSPVTGLYTDAGATTTYASQSLSTVFAQPNTTTTYTATATNGAGCTATQTVNINVSPTPVVTITTDYCVVPGKVRLTASSVPVASSYLWSTGAVTSFIDVDVAGSFDVTVFAGGGCPGTASINVAQELVVNGDFESGNVGFTTPPLGPNQYIYQADVAGNSELVPEGLYGIGPDAHTYHNGFWGHDHTTGTTGNFMIINGFPNGNPQPIVWQEVVNVLPNTTYYFAAWGMSVNAAGPFAQLQFNVNGAQVGTVATLPAGVNNNSNNGWTRFYGTWTSGPTTTSAIISITDLQNAAGGNDFGLDDISFATLSTFITLESAPGTDAQTLCINTPLTNIVYSVGNGSPTGPTVTGLPTGVTSSFVGNQLTISGTPTQPGNFTYTITTTGGCLPTSATGTITVQAQAIALSSGSANTTTCVNTAVSIGYTLSGTATGATVSGLPAGVTGSVAGTTYTISGTPTVPGIYSYTITTTGTCAAATTSGTITVQSQTITLNSGNNNQTVCINAAIANIQYTVGGTATGAVVSGLPAGVSFTYSGGLVFIFGSPTASGLFTYTVTTSGNCAAATATGTITVNPAASLVLSSAAGTDGQSICRNVAITAITYLVNGGTGAVVSGLPTGITGSYSAGIVTISGTPTVNGIFNYTVTTTGGCGSGTATGTITVLSQTIVLSGGNASPTLCNNTAMTNIVYTIGGSATGATITGLPAGVAYVVAGNNVTISGTPTVNGSFPYTVTTSGTCAAATANGTITIQPGAVGGTVASVTICSGGSGTLTVTGQTGTIVRWEYTIDGGATWIPIANTTITQTYNNITDPTGYRAVVTNGCGNATSTTAMIAIHNYWTGVTNTDWNTASNWADNLVPTLFCADVHIKGGKPNQPTLGSGIAIVENIHVYTGAVLTITNATLRVSGVIDNTGTIIAGNGTVDLNGTSAQSIAANTFQNNALANLIVSNSSITGITLGGPLDIYRSLTYTGTGKKLSTGGFLTMKSTITETAWIGDLTGNVITGDATVERYIGTGTGAAPNHGKSWQLLATPTQGQTIKQAWQEGAVTNNGNPNPGFGTMLTSNVPNAATQPDPGFDVFTQPGPSIKTYNSATNTYVGPASTNDPIYNQKGYFILVRGDRSVTAFNTPANPTVLRTKGMLFSPSNPPATSNVTAGSFESVGNPYASAIDVRNVARTGGVDEFFYVWDPRLGGNNGLGAFQTLFKIGANYFAMPGGGSYGAGVNNFIQSGQAFLVQATGTNGTVGFSESVKANGSALLTRNNDNQSVASLSMLQSSLYSVAADGSTSLNDGTINVFGDDYSNEVDGLDANKPANTGENLSVKTNGHLLTVERRHTVAQHDTIFLNLSGTRVQNYRFQFTTNDMGDNLEGFVEDNYLQTRTALTMNGITEVDFNIANIAGSYAPDRFRIVFSRPVVVVPVTFTSIKAYQQGKNNQVEWKTENEINVKQYEVQESANGSDFTTFVVKAPAGTNGASASYLAVDEHPHNGNNYYRVRSIDHDGKAQYTNVVRVFVETPKSEIAIYPNPITNGIVNLQLINLPAGEYTIRLHDKNGQLIMSKKVNHAEGSSTEKINWDYSLAHGMYFLEVIQPGGTKKVIKVLY